MNRKYLLIGLIAIPFAAFYLILAREAVNIPFLDDYSGILGFLIEWARLGTVHEKALRILTAQHNEYKLIFANAIYAAGCSIFGRINFLVLATIGNLFVVPIYIVLYKMWFDDKRVIQDPLLAFVPVSWILFQLQYYSLLDWPGCSLQNIAVVVFSLWTFYFLSKDGTRTFLYALGSLCLAICASGNGFFVVPLGCVMLAQFRRPAKLACWVLLAIAMLGVYLYKYNFHASQSGSDHSTAAALTHLSPIYALSFLGASIAGYGFYLPAALFGLCLCSICIYTVRDRLYRKNPALFYSMCFVLITAVAVSGLRSDFGISQSLVSRYRIYSNLLLILVYLYGIGRLSDRWLGDGLSRLRKVVVVATVLAVAFNLASNYVGFKLLRIRSQLTREGLSHWEHGESQGAPTSGPAGEDPIIRRQRLHGNYTPEDAYLREAIRLQIYIPPSM